MTNLPYFITCNGAVIGPSANDNKRLDLNYLASNKKEPNVKLLLPKFIRSVYHIEDKILDLLEIATYVYAADRLISRGSNRAVEYHSWARKLNFHIKVRDEKFWNNSIVKDKLSALLNFLTGDYEYKFEFQSGHKTSKVDLFDRKGIALEEKKDPKVVLFSGGLDSFSGVADLLVNTNSDLCLVSHQSQPGVAKTQKTLFRELVKRNQGRLVHYPYECSLRGTTAKEESQRSRSFLYCCIAFAIAHTYDIKEFYVFENGITSLNISLDQDSINARASRTTHPQTHSLMEELFSSIDNNRIKIVNPYFWLTKTEIVEKIKENQYTDLISSTVSCSHTFQNFSSATHCGGCMQCVDRRFAAYAAGLSTIDNVGIYNGDFIQDKIEHPEARTVLLDYVRTARIISEWSIDKFEENLLSELSQIVGFENSYSSDIQLVEEIYRLLIRHCNSVKGAIQNMIRLHHNPMRQLQKPCLLSMVFDEKHFKKPSVLLAENIIEILKLALPSILQHHAPTNEMDLNSKIHGVLTPHYHNLRSEYPTCNFACARVIVDHSIPASLSDYQLLIEAKYLRDSTTPSKASEGIAADLIKYPSETYKLFIVYDPHHQIHDDAEFTKDFEHTRDNSCKVEILH